MKKSFDPCSLTGENNPLPRFPALYEAALEEFSQKSWAEASLNDVLRRGGLSKGSLYHHFGDKFGLYVALVDSIAQRKLAFFLPRLRGLGTGGDFFRAVKDVSREMMAFMFEDPRVYRFSARMQAEDPALIRRLADCFPREKGEAYLALAEGAVKTGQVDKRFSPRFVQAILQILLNNLHLLPNDGGVEGAYRQLELALDVMQYGLSAREPGGDQESTPKE